MRRAVLIILLIIGGVFNSAFAASSPKQKQSLWADMTYLENSDAFLSSTNASWLKFVEVNSLSIVELYGQTEQGSFTNYNQSDDSYTLGGQTKSYYRLNDKVTLYGRMCYADFAGKDMGNSVWIAPYDAPFNMVEYTADNTGKKSLETYELAGAMALELTPHLTVGGRMNYVAANYAKMKDLRHQNKLMDMDLSLGMMYQPLSWLDFGLNYIFRKRVEELQFSTFGTADNIYNSLISWGGFWGSVEVFNDAGFTASGDKKPLLDKYNGLAVQFNLHFSPKLTFFNELTLKKRSGYYGVDSYNTIVYAKHRGELLNYKGTLSLLQSRVKHLWSLAYNRNSLVNYKTNYSMEYDPDQSISYTVYYDPSKMLDRTYSQLNMNYQAHFDYRNLCPTWSLFGVINYRNENQIASVYPYYRMQDISRVSASLAAQHNIIKDANKYGIGLGMQFDTGWGEPYNDGTYVTPSASQQAPQTTDFNLYKEYEYFTANSYVADVNLEYSHLLKERKCRLYTKLNYQLRYAPKVVYHTGNTFNHLTFAIGCSF